jgi:hypothetical protein
MLQHEVRGPSCPMTSCAALLERTWHAFLNDGWPTTR